MKYKRVLAAFLAHPWAILPEKLAEMRAVLATRAGGKKIKAADVKAAMGGRKPDGVQMVGRVAVLPVFGVISQRVGMMERASGGVSTEEVGAALDALVADKQVKAIVLAFDSPGGSVLGVAELAAKIRAARGEKKIVGLADSIAASAAYWLIAQTSEINVTPGGQVGSIGVIAAHEDYSEHMKEHGIATTLITSSQYKGEGNPYEPLSDEARAEIQSKVNAYHAMFVADVAKGRGVTENRVEKDFGQGRMMMAADAVAKGMADRVATLEQVLRRLGAGESAGPSAEAVITIPAAEVLPTPEEKQAFAEGLGNALAAQNRSRAAARARAVEIENAN